MPDTETHSLDDRLSVELRTDYVVGDGDPTAFAFTDEGLRWREFEASLDEIVAARRLVQSFGSCSFDEPRDGLRALGWM